MKFRNYLADRIVSLVCFTNACILTFLFLWLIGTPIVFILFLEVILFVITTAATFWDYGRRKSYYNMLLNLLNQLDKKTLLTEISEQPQFLDGQILLDILRRSNKYQNDQIAELEYQNREYREYLETWVHEIKTPITAAKLIVENDKNPVTIRIDDELLKIEKFVEQVLYYARSTDVEKDFKIEKTTLKELVMAALKNYSKPIIQAEGQLNICEIDIPIYADTKWCSFIIGQIVSNSIKYRRDEFELSFYAKVERHNVYLTIADNGIGISTTDLPRVFEKGFTGENGRRFSKSTGIGLYLCEKLCAKMNIGLSVDSIQDHGTKVTLCFQNENQIPEAGV